MSYLVGLLGQQQQSLFMVTRVCSLPQINLLKTCLANVMKKQCSKSGKDRLTTETGQVK